MDEEKKQQFITNAHVSQLKCWIFEADDEKVLEEDKGEANFGKTEVEPELERADVVEQNQPLRNRREPAYLKALLSLILCHTKIHIMLCC